MNGVENVTGIVSFQLHHWCLPPYIQGFGGNIFRNPPADIMPALNCRKWFRRSNSTPAVEEIRPKGVLTYTEDQARQALLTGRSNIFIHSSAWITPILMSGDSKVKDTSRVVRMPAGPVRDFPAANSQGLGIPKNAKNKKAAWEFIKWALSPEISMRLVKEHGHSSVCRKSVIESGNTAGSTPSTARTSARSISRCWGCRPGAKLHGLSHREGIPDRGRCPQ